MAEPRKLPDHVTLPLLTLVTTQSLDSEYQHVADRKAASGRKEVPNRSLRNTVVVVALFGLMTAIAFVQTERNAEDSEAGRQRLIRSITQERETLADRQSRIADLRKETRTLTDRVDRVSANEASANTTLLQVRGIAGYAPVTGPGVLIRLDDSPDGSPEGRVRDEDLAMLVNGLWASGAEAISINGHRLTSLTGIRNVGVAVHIKAQPLKPPYVVEAIGDPNTLQSLFVESQPGVEFTILRNTFGFEFEMENSRTMSLPPSRTPRLRSARVHTSRSEKSSMDQGEMGGEGKP